MYTPNFFRKSEQKFILIDLHVLIFRKKSKDGRTGKEPNFRPILIGPNIYSTQIFQHQFTSSI